MLASITPLGERGRGGHWAITISAFAFGATAAAIAIGAIVASLGVALLGHGVGSRARLAVLAAALLVALGLDLRSGNAPGPQRQVNERWLDEFRGWVYGLGFGAQLGVGVTTVVRSAATYAALLAAFLSGAAGRGALIVGCAGLVRGLTPLVAARVDRPDRLIRMHAAIERWRKPAARVGLALLGLLLALALAGALA